MSKNAFAHRRPARDRRALAATSLEGKTLGEIAAEARTEARIVNSIQRVAHATRYVSTDGLARLVETGLAAVEAATGQSMPYNIITGQGRCNLADAAGSPDPGRYGRRLTADEAERLIELAARAGGWLKAAAKLPALRRVIGRTQSGNGVNSPRTTIDLWSVVVRWPSPGGLERKLWATRARAQAILTAYEGQTPSWAAITQALMSERRVGKAAVLAVAYHLGYTGGYYKSARDWLVAHRRARCATSSVAVIRQDCWRLWTEEVYPLLGTEPERRFGWSVQPALQVDRFGRPRLVDLIRSAEYVRTRALNEGWSEYHWEVDHVLEAWDRLAPEFQAAVTAVQSAAALRLAEWRGRPQVTRRQSVIALLQSWDTERAALLVALSALGNPLPYGVEDSREALEERLTLLSDATAPRR